MFGIADEKAKGRADGPANTPFGYAIVLLSLVLDSAHSNSQVGADAAAASSKRLPLIELRVCTGPPAAETEDPRVGSDAVHEFLLRHVRAAIAIRLH